MATAIVIINRSIFDLIRLCSSFSVIISPHCADMKLIIKGAHVSIFGDLSVVM